MTDHFILIMGKTETYKKGLLQGIEYRFFDPRTTKRYQGTSKQNTLSVTKGYLKGSYLVKNKNYAVTSIRKTKKAK